MNEDLFSDQPAPKVGADELFSEERAPESIGKLESFTRGAVNNFPLAPQAVAGLESLTGIGNEGGYSKNLEDWNLHAGEAKAANPITYGAGAVTGAVAPLAIPGVGELMAANPILGNAAYGALSAVSNKNLAEKPLETAKEAAIGGTIGGALGGAGKLLGKAGEAIAPAAKELEANVAASTLDLGTFGLRKLARMEGPKANPEEVLMNIDKEMRSLFPDLIKPLDTPSMKFEKLAAADKAAGETIGNVIDQTTEAMKPYSKFKFGKFKQLENPVMPEADTAIRNLKSAARQYDPLTSARNVEARAELNDAATALGELKKAGKLNFRSLADLKTGIGKAYNNPNFENPGLDETYHILSKTMDTILDRVMPDNPALAQQYQQAKQIYHLTSRVLPAMQRGVTREVAGVGGGLTNAAIGAGAIFGHPITAAAAWLGKTGMKYLAPDVVPNVLYRMIGAAKSGTFPKIVTGAAKQSPQAIRQAMTDFLTSKYSNQQAQ